MSALPTPTVPDSSRWLASRVFNLDAALANPLLSPPPPPAPTYAQNKLIGRGSASGAGIAEEITLGTNISLSGTTVNVAATGGGGGGGLDPQTAIYPTFTVGANDDEFDDASFSGWTAVNDGSNVPTITETNNVCSISVPGGHAAADLAAYMKTVTPAANDYIEMAFRGAGRTQNHNICGLIMADGSTYTAGVQVLFYFSANENSWPLTRHTGYNTQGTFTGHTCQTSATMSDMFLRLKYEGSNNWSGWASADGVSWFNATGTIAYTLTPTRIGFFVSSWGGSLPFGWSLRYFRHSA
jgi:hypothetical protein